MEKEIRRENQRGGRVRRTQPDVAAKRGKSKECGRPLQAGKGVETDCPLEPLEGT